MNDVTFARQVSTERIAEHRQRVDQIERMTLGELYRHQRAIVAGLHACAQHPEPAYREDVTAILAPLCYDLGTYRDCPAVWLHPGDEIGLAEELMTLGADLQKHAPRKTAAIWASVRLDLSASVVWFDLKPAPECEMAAA